MNKNVLNRYPQTFARQRWLTAHNAWNTEIAPNQIKTITELLDYGVRGFALDIYGDDKGSLHLQHGHGNIGSWTDWSVVQKEIAEWLAANTQDVVTLFFESYLEGPTLGNPNTALRALSDSLAEIPCYQGANRTAQEQAMKTVDLMTLVNTNHRLFAFIEAEPNEGGQSLFPQMTTMFAENMYGDDSVHRETWTNLRPGSSYDNPLTFMNHFGNAPSGSASDRNDPALLLEHANAFSQAFGGRLPNFISLDVIDWTNPDDGPLAVVNNWP